MQSSISGTTLKPTIGGFTEQVFNQFLRDRDEPTWLTARRREAFARFQAFAWPTSRDEEWRRTDIRGLRLNEFNPPAHGEPSARSSGLLENTWTALNSQCLTGIEHINGALGRTSA